MASFLNVYVTDYLQPFIVVNLLYSGSTKESKENIEKIAEDITNNFLKLSKRDDGKSVQFYDLIYTDYFSLRVRNKSPMRKDQRCSFRVKNNGFWSQLV